MENENDIQEQLRFWSRQIMAISNDLEIIKKSIQELNMVIYGK